MWGVGAARIFGYELLSVVGVVVLWAIGYLRRLGVRNNPLFSGRLDMEFVVLWAGGVVGGGGGRFGTFPDMCFIIAM